MPCIVSAYSNNRKLVIGQIKADEKSNEISAIPDLLDLLYIKGAIVSIDAAGCQKKIVRKIIRQDGGYVISLKGNQTKMHDEIQMFMQDATFKRKFKKARTVDKGHWQGPLGVASLRSASVLSSQYSAVSVSKELNHPLHWLLVVGCWLLKHFGRRPIAEASA
jgi:hypothetical protein